MELSSLAVLFLSFCSLFLCFHLFAFYVKNQKPCSGFKTYPFLHNLPDFLLNRHHYLDWSTSILRSHPTNTVVFHRPWKTHGVLTANPLNVEHVLKTNFENYPKGPQFIETLEDFLGRGIFNSDGEIWKVQRKTASYEFNSKSLRYFVMDNITVETQTRLLPIFEKASKNGSVLNLQDILEKFTFDNVCKVAFNVDPGCLSSDGKSSSSEFMAAFETATTLCSGRFMYAFPFIWKIKRFFNLGSERTLRKSIQTVHNYADSIIRSRMEEKNKEKDADLLSRFMENPEHSGEFLRDIVISFILAGRDTTSALLSWFFWIISSKPEIQQKILQELEKIRNKNGKNIGDPFSFDEIREMQYLHAAISETLRLYPSIPIDSKFCMKDDILPDGTFIGKGWFLSYHMYAMGRMESIWGKNWSEFSPERWLENGICKQESPFRYPAFNGGLRMCLGKEMAGMQMKAIAASLLERFEISVVYGKSKGPEHLHSLTLKIKGGLPVVVRDRWR